MSAAEPENPHELRKHLGKPICVSLIDLGNEETKQMKLKKKKSHALRMHSVKFGPFKNTRNSITFAKYQRASRWSSKTRQSRQLDTRRQATVGGLTLP